MLNFPMIVYSDMFEIIPTYFFVTLLISLFVLYITAPEPKIVIKYPDVNKEKSDLYIDDNNVCYRYKREEVACDKI